MFKSIRRQCNAKDGKRWTVSVSLSGVSAPLAAAEPNPEEIELDDVDDDLDPDDPDMPGSPREAAAAVKNAEEIDIDDVAESEEESLDPG